MNPITRRRLIASGIAVTAGAAGLGAASRIAARYGLVPPDSGGVYGPGETLTYAAERLLTRNALAREFPRSKISAKPFANELSPFKDDFKLHQSQGFRNWTLLVDGAVAHPTTFSLADIRSLGLRSQITEVACEEGWSYIAEWIGTPVSAILKLVQPAASARYLVYYSIEHELWDSIDLAEALHPQTILTTGMNDADLPVAFGGPLRMRVPRQLGYKNLKFITRLTVADSLKHFGKGLGSVDPEFGYSWCAGI